MSTSASSSSPSSSEGRSPIELPPANKNSNFKNSSSNSVDLILKAPGAEAAKTYKFWNILIPTLLVAACIGNMFRLGGWKNIKIKFPFSSKEAPAPPVVQKASKLYPEVSVVAKDEALANAANSVKNSDAMKAQIASKIDKMKGLNKNSKL